LLAVSIKVEVSRYNLKLLHPLSRWTRTLNFIVRQLFECMQTTLLYIICVRFSFSDAERDVTSLITEKYLSKEKTNLMPIILLFIQYSFNAQHFSAVNTTIFRSLRLTGCYFMCGIWFGVCWRSVSVWLWRCGVFMQSEALLNK